MFQVRRGYVIAATAVIVTLMTLVNMIMMIMVALDVVGLVALDVSKNIKHEELVMI
jgi:hypothetical protein